MFGRFEDCLDSFVLTLNIIILFWFRSIDQMSKLPNAATYEKYAYHVSLLKQFNAQSKGGNSRQNGKGDDLPSSVHGTNVFRAVSIRGKASRRSGPSNDQLASSIRSV